MQKDVVNVQTFCKRVRILEVVFEPETISELEITKLSGYDASKCGSKDCAIVLELSNASWPQVYIIHMSAHKNTNSSFYRIGLCIKKQQK